jgi:hypothetical protein
MDAPVIFAGFDVGIDDVFDKVRRRCNFATAF